MSDSTAGTPGTEWFCALLDTAPDVYFRYALPARRFVYVSPSVHALTSHTHHEFYADPSLCLALVSRADRRKLAQIVRARRGLTLTLHLLRDGASIPVEVRTVAVTHGRHVVAVEGLARLTASTVRPANASPADHPTQQRLAALMYEVHDLLHRVLPSSTGRQDMPRVVRVGSLSFDPDRLVAREGDEPVALTSRETLVLRYVLERPGVVITRQQLLEEVWGYRYTGDDRTVDVHVSRLRRKLPSLRDRLVAIRHVGYRLDVETAAKISNF
jgi:DNA-binding winged helix-turn-helix (wHTH) protein